MSQAARVFLTGLPADMVTQVTEAIRQQAGVHAPSINILQVGQPLPVIQEPGKTVLVLGLSKPTEPDASLLAAHRWHVQLLGLALVRRIPWLAVTAPEMDHPTRCQAVGAFTVVPWSIASAGLAAIVLEGFDRTKAPSPSLAECPVAFLLRTLHMLRATGMVRIEAGQGVVGQVAVRDGETIHAEIDGEQGQPALTRLMRLPRAAAGLWPLRPGLVPTLSGTDTDESQDAPDPAVGTEARPNVGPDVGGDRLAAQEELPSSEQHMASVNATCQAVVEDVGDALACGVVDLTTGMLLGVHHVVPHFTQAYLDAVAAAAVDMFRGKNVKRVEDLLSKQRGKPIRDSFEEIFISSPMVFHFMKTIREKNAAVVLVTKKTTNQGMGWAALRNSISDIAASL